MPELFLHVFNAAQASVIFTDWVVGWDSVRKQWYKIHVTVDTEILGQYYLRNALRNRDRTFKARRFGVIIEAQR